MDFVYDLLKLNKKLELGMSEESLVDHIFVKIDTEVQDYEEVQIPQNTVQLLEVSYLSLDKDIHAKQCRIRTIVIMLKDDVRMSVGCLMLKIVEEIGEILKLCVYQVMAEMIKGVAMKMAVKVINGTRQKEYLSEG
ncbi:uncharacterized protein TNCV_2224051 [Trichonephila clavipes]|nr:uncharacterized protein TNCV_2224051 [Trichonephila clavipes]